MSGDSSGEAAVESGDAILDELWAVIEARKAERPEGSYTADLLDHENGLDGVLEKLGEEHTELLLAATEGDPDAIAHEAADVVYHLLVLLAATDLDLADLRAELRERRG